MEDRIEQIRDYLENLDDDSLLYIYRNYCDETENVDDDIYSMDDFDEIMESTKPWEVARACYFGDFRPCDKYFEFNGYGNIVSFNYISDKVDIDEIARFIVENNNSLYDGEIESILNGEDEE